MSHKQLLSTVTADDKHSRLEILLSPTDGGKPALELRRLSWGRGVGWYRQHTLRLSPAEATALLHSVCRSRSAWREGRQAPSGKVIPFPTRQHERGGQQHQLGEDRAGNRSKRAFRNAEPPAETA